MPPARLIGLISSVLAAPLRASAAAEAGSSLHSALNPWQLRHIMTCPIYGSVESWFSGDYVDLTAEEHVRSDGLA